jgi:radical SAM protein with 4Fe4S-binding SPASM domain
MKYWDHIQEYEIDGEWRAQLPKEHLEYRKLFAQAQEGKFDGPFPLSLEIEASYYCNLKCPLCPRVPGAEEKSNKHMSMGLFARIIREAQSKGLKALMMDHEAESLMNPRLLEMIKIARNAGIIDLWLHTNANLLKPDISEKLIDCGITKINFSIDAATESTYQIVREGGDFKQCVSNVMAFLEEKNRKSAANVRTRVSFVVCDTNRHEQESFFEFWKDVPGLNLITFQDAIDFSGFDSPDEDSHLSIEQLDKAYADQPPFFCSQPWETPIIDTDGNVAPCGSPVRAHNKDFFLGNLKAGDSIEDCFTSKKMKELRYLHKNNLWYRNPMCRVCARSQPGSPNDTQNLIELR